LKQLEKELKQCFGLKKSDFNECRGGNLADYVNPKAYEILEDIDHEKKGEREAFFEYLKDRSCIKNSFKNKIVMGFSDGTYPC
jgi:hypothetical protein